MTITIDKLESLAERQGLTYFVAPDRPALLVTVAGATGHHQVLMHVELDGRFVQLRTMGYGQCPSDHPRLEAVLRVIGALDYTFRLTKFGWDPTDGEIVGYADLWLEDAKLGQKQFAAMLGAFIPAIDLGRVRIAAAMETGVDPGGSGGPGPRPDLCSGMGDRQGTPDPTTV
jgi:hypothetical protein